MGAGGRVALFSRWVGITGEGNTITTGLGRWLVAMMLAVAAVLLSQTTGQAQTIAVNATGSKNVALQEWYVQGAGTVTMPAGGTAWQVEVKIYRIGAGKFPSRSLVWTSPSYFASANGPFSTGMQMVNNSALLPLAAGTQYEVFVTGTYSTAGGGPFAFPAASAFITVYP